MSVRRVLASVVVSAVLLGGLSGCGGDEPDPGAKPKLPEPTSESPSPKVSSTVEDETAEEFIERWHAVADLMVTSGDSSEFRAISKGCLPCASYADRIVDAHRHGAKVSFGGSTVEKVLSAPGRSPRLIVTVTSARLTIVGGDEPVTYPEATQRYRMTLRRSPSGWLMSHYSVL